MSAVPAVTGCQNIETAHNFDWMRKSVFWFTLHGILTLHRPVSFVDSCTAIFFVHRGYMIHTVYAFTLGAQWSLKVQICRPGGQIVKSVSCHKSEFVREHLMTCGRSRGILIISLGQVSVACGSGEFFLALKASSEASWPHHPYTLLLGVRSPKSLDKQPAAGQSVPY